jgi:hypothetical protein
MNGIWERVLANSFLGIHKSKSICSVVELFKSDEYSPLLPLPLSSPNIYAVPRLNTPNREKNVLF